MVSKRDMELLLGIIVASFIIVTLVVPMLPQFGIYMGTMRGQVAGGQIPTKISINTTFAQGGFFGTTTFSGYLKDMNNNPLSGKTISLNIYYGQTNTSSATTNGQGYYEFKFTTATGYQKVTASYAGELQYVASSIICVPTGSDYSCQNESTIVVQPQGPIIVCGSGSAGTCPVPGDTCSDFKCDYSTCDCVVNQDQEVGSDRIYTFKSFKINAGRTVSVQKVANAVLNGMNGGQGGAGGAGGQVSTCNQWGGCSGCGTISWCAIYHTRYPSYCPCTGYSYSSQSGGGGGGPSASGGTGPGGAGGSNSGGGGGTTGGQGAGSITIIAETITIDGALRVEGAAGSSLGGGGGGGLVKLNCTSISVSGTLTANGGAGAGCGGGGGGGYIRVNYKGSKTIAGTVSANGGAGGSCGTAGTNGLIHYAVSDVENCTNGIDDNGNDLIDCADPGCVNSACQKSGCTAAGCGSYVCKSIAFWDNPTTIDAQKCAPTANACIGVCSSDCPGGVTPPTGINYVVSRSEGYEGSNDYGCFKGKWSLCNEGRLDVTQTTSAGTTYYCCRDGSSFSWRTCPCASPSCTGQGPTPSSNSVSSTAAGTSVQFRLKWTSTTGLSGYIFSFDNCRGSFVNSTWTAMTGTSNWSNVTKAINSTVGCTIRWRVYANDSSNNWGTSDIYSFTTTQPVEPFTYSNFNCYNTTKICNMTCTNNAGESVKIVLLLLKDHVFRAYNSDSVAVGSGTFSAFPFSCSGLQAGEYQIMFLVYRVSDTSFRLPVYSGPEQRAITCP